MIYIEYFEIKVYLYLPKFLTTKVLQAQMGDSVYQSQLDGMQKDTIRCFVRTYDTDVKGPITD